MLLMFEQTIGNASSTMRENLSKVQGVLSTSVPIFSSDINRRIQASNAAYSEGEFLRLSRGGICVDMWIFQPTRACRELRKHGLKQLIAWRRRHSRHTATCNAEWPRRPEQLRALQTAFFRRPAGCQMQLMPSTSWRQRLWVAFAGLRKVWSSKRHEKITPQVSRHASAAGGA